MTPEQQVDRIAAALEAIGNRLWWLCLMCFWLLMIALSMVGSHR